ncbi:Clavaminate synthase-like protein [Bimuria novae-zelandiae CBS 107.79]|uniref:Clavaminate synthase-like protein n=1 Tax=Bimuria novae-zelandiae CBS 107.79 TaxID=1447943 RepID=A0A6A5UNG0_9PLEO|nr:Clavaminate synthase-like protein [Bimuria novae-zelandiae CBS 107.79]
MPHSETKDADIPIISISHPTLEVAQQVLSAASTHGFLFICNDGSILPTSSINKMFDLSARVFSQPTIQKATHAIHTPEAGGLNCGWVRMSGESLDPSHPGDPKEAFNIAPPTSSSPLQPLPSPLSSSATEICDFLGSCHDLCTRILTLLGAALRIPEEEGGESWFADRHDESKGPSGTIFRMLYYPATTAQRGEGEQRIRAGAHSDYGSITLLFRLPGQPGLEILKPDGTWAPVPVNPPSPTSNSSSDDDAKEMGSPPILVNIGDLLCFWTNGMLKSTVHRVTFSGGEERYSMAYFCHPLDGARLEAVPGAVIQAYGDKGREEVGRQRERLGLGGGAGSEVLTAKEHLDRRLKVTYGLKD